VNGSNAASAVSRASLASSKSIPGLSPQAFPPGYSPPGAAAKAASGKKRK
ncbi:putative eukaryotic initiation factor-2A, partial [Toxoplasma gondii p89]